MQVHQCEYGVVSDWIQGASGTGHWCFVVYNGMCHAKSACCVLRTKAVVMATPCNTGECHQRHLSFIMGLPLN